MHGGILTPILRACSPAIILTGKKQTDVHINFINIIFSIKLKNVSFVKYGYSQKRAFSSGTVQRIMVRLSS